MKIVLASIATIMALHSMPSQAEIEIKIFKYKTGEIRAKTSYVKKQKHGVETWFYRTGERKSTVHFVEGLKQGYKNIYFKTGRIKQKRLYKDNLYLPLPTEYTASRDQACVAKLPVDSNVSPKFIKCQTAIDTLLLSENESKEAIEVIKKLTTIYLKNK